MARRERTRHLIELGGLVQKAELVGITDDDRAMLYGAFLDLAQRMRGQDGAQLMLLYRRRGARAFATEAEELAAARAQAARSRSTGERSESEDKR